MKILRFQAANIKKLSVVDITPDGNLVQISGANGAGKSSVLDAIQYALEGKTSIPSQPVRQGEFRAKIRLDLGEVIVTRSFKAGSDSTLVVESADGSRFSSPQKLLDELLGALAFDPLEFSRMPAKEQLDQIRSLAKLEVDIDELDRQNATDYAARTEINRTTKSLTEKANDLFVRMNPSLPKEPIDADGLITQLETAAGFNAAIEREGNRRAMKTQTLDSYREAATTKREQAKMLLHEAEVLEKSADSAQVQLDTLPPLDEQRDTAAIRAEIDRARQVNVGIAINRDYATAKTSEETARKAADELTERMEARNRKKADAIAAASMPIEGLGFGEGMVLYNELPFDQASSAEQLRISVAIAMAANPKLRVLRIKDGSLLDETSLRMIADMAVTGDYQVWMEVVDTSGNVGIVLEDGAVTRVNKALVGSQSAG